MLYRNPFFFKGIISKSTCPASAALINFCEGVERDTLLSYLDPIVERILQLLNIPAGNPFAVRRYVQEQAIMTLAMVTDASWIRVKSRLERYIIGMHSSI